MIEIVRKVLANILTALYQPFGVALIVAVLAMFVYMFVKQYGWKSLLQQWWRTFRKDKGFRCFFLLSFYTALILARTLFNRYMWMNPVSNVIGIWGFYNEKGEMTTEIIENLILFIPFTILFLWSFHDKLFEKKIKLPNTLWKSVSTVFWFSLSIECVQLFLRLGTFQLSDLFYNTLGGLLGGLIYWVGYKINSRMKKGKEE